MPSSLLALGPIRAPRFLLCGSDWLMYPPQGQKNIRHGGARSQSHTQPTAGPGATPPEPDDGGGRLVIPKQTWNALPRRGNACWEALQLMSTTGTKLSACLRPPPPFPLQPLRLSLPCLNPKRHPAQEALCPVITLLLGERKGGRQPHSLISLSDIFCHLSGEQASPLITAKGERVFKTRPVKIC